MTESSFDYIRENYKVITDQMNEAVRQAGVPEGSVTLLAATKTVPPEQINYAIQLGLKAVGENKVQELMEKYDSLKLDACDCQFIGRLQTNKIKYLVGKVSQIQSIDSMSQVKELSRQLSKSGGDMKVLLEVNIGEETNKGGVLPEALTEFLEEAGAYKNVHVNGLMAVPPICEDKSLLRAYFLRMKKYYVDIQAKKLDNVNMNILSMGMSYDFVDAIACGANMVRIGSSLFGKRLYK